MRNRSATFRRLLLTVILGILTVGCYHATVNTGLNPSAQTYTESFASSWVYGLVPPSTVEAAEHCPNGVARVETKLSFVNQLVGIITLGIYTPMNIQVTCAGGSQAQLPHSEMIAVPAESDAGLVLDKISEAADRAVQLDRPVYIHFE